MVSMVSVFVLAASRVLNRIICFKKKEGSGEEKLPA